MKLVFLALLLGVASAYPADYVLDDELQTDLGHIRNFLKTPEGLQTAREYIKSLEPRFEAVFMVKTFLEGSEDEVLWVLLDDLLKDVKPVEISKDVDVHALFYKVELEIKADPDGAVKLAKAYFQNLEPRTLMVARLREMVLNADDNDLREVVLSILPDVFYYQAGEYDLDSALEIGLGHIRNFLNTAEGLQTARDYVRALEVRHPMIFMVKAFLEGATDKALWELLEDLLRDIKPIETTSDVDVHALFYQVELLVKNDPDEAVRLTREYFEKLQPETLLVGKLREMVLMADDGNLRDVLLSILPDVYYYAATNVKERLRELFSEIRSILITSEGIQVVRDYARALEPTHPALFLVKAFIESAGDDILLEILDEFFKNFDQTTNDYVSKRLEELFLEVRSILHTEEGFAAMRNYLVNIKSEHPIVGRLHQFISHATDETLREILDALFGDA